MYNIKIILRNLQRGGIYSVINIGGLAVGMAASALLLIWVFNQWSCDRFHEKAKQIYQVWDRSTSNGQVHCHSMSSLVIGPELKNQLPEIVESVRVSFPSGYYFGEGDRHLSLRTQHVDPSFFTMFNFKLLHGDANTALNDPYSIILTEKAARRLFGDEDPMGKTLMCNAKYPVTVTGIMKDLPGNTRFDFEILGSFQFIEKVLIAEKALVWDPTSWWINVITTYVELAPNAQLDRLNASICDIMKSNTNNWKEAFLFPMDKSYLYDFENGVPVGGRITYLRMSALLAVIILLIACINFVNLSTARATLRAREVGVRKVMGSRRIELIRLFLGESLIMAFVSGIIAFIFVHATLPYFSGWFSGIGGKVLTLDISSIHFWIFALSFICLTGLLSGCYPAFYLSAFQPAKVIKGVVSAVGSRFTLRKILVVLQFSVAVFLIITVLVMRKQLIHAQNRDMGYDVEHLIYISFPDEIKKHYTAFRNDLITSGAVIDVTRTSVPITSNQGNTDGVWWQGRNPEVTHFFSYYFADGNWAEMMGVELVAGRHPDPATMPADSSAFLISESTAKIFGFEDPVGETISFWGHEGQVVGVIKDFLLTSPLYETYPIVVGCTEKIYERSALHIRLNSGKTGDKLASVEKIFRQYCPNHPFDYKFVDEEYAAVNLKDIQIDQLLTTSYSIVAILISCMGLFALVAYTAERRRKEIGIRKVLGASVADITWMLSKEYLALTLIAFAIAAPLAWLAMQEYLNGFAYRTEITVWMILLVGILIMLITLITVCSQAIKAAMANPVNEIRNE